MHRLFRHLSMIRFLFYWCAGIGLFDHRVSRPPRCGVYFRRRGGHISGDFAFVGTGLRPSSFIVSPPISGPFFGPPSRHGRGFCPLSHYAFFALFFTTPPPPTTSSDSCPPSSDGVLRKPPRGLRGFLCFSFANMVSGACQKSAVDHDSRLVLLPLFCRMF